MLLGTFCSSKQARYIHVLIGNRELSNADQRAHFFQMSQLAEWHFAAQTISRKIYSVADFVLKADVTASQITLWKIDLETCFLPRDSSCTKMIWLCGNFKTFRVPLSPIHQTFLKKNILKAFLFFTHTHNDNVCKLSLGNSTVTYRRLNPYTLAGIRTRDLVLFAADAMTSIPRRHGRAIYQAY
jgi:hypothetical protein